MQFEELNLSSVELVRLEYHVMGGFIEVGLSRGYSYTQ
jgi:hypothetical protein